MTHPEAHALTLESKRVDHSRGIGEMMYHAACSCGEWSVTNDKTAKVCRAMHAEHLQSVLGPNRKETT